jgi:hypothetical protein
MRWDAVNFVWQRWVLNYHNQQSDLLRSLLGELTALRLALAFLIPMLCIVGWISFQLLRSSQRQRHYDALDQRLVKLSLKLEKKGLARKSGETISDYLVRLSSLYPEQQQQLNDLARQYQQLRYASATEDENPQLIKSLSERLKLLSKSL